MKRSALLLRVFCAVPGWLAPVLLMPSVVAAQTYTEFDPAVLEARGIDPATARFSAWNPVSRPDAVEWCLRSTAGLWGRLW